MAITSLADLANVFSGSSARSGSAKSASVATLLGASGENKLLPSAVDLGGLSQAIDLQSSLLSLRSTSTQLAQSSSALQVAGQGITQVQSQFTQLRKITAEAAKPETTDAQRKVLQKQANDLLSASDQAVKDTTFQNVSLLDGSAASQNLAEKLGIQTADVSSNTLLEGQSIDLSSAASAQAALERVSTALDTITAAQTAISAETDAHGQASATLASALQNQDAARSTLLSSDIFGSNNDNFAAALLKQEPSKAVYAQSNNLRSSVLDLLNG